MRHSRRFLIVVALCGVSLVRTAGAQSVPATDSSAFHPGDRIVLRVDGEPQLSDTFTVRDGPALELPTVGRVSLRGRHHDDLEAFLAVEIGRFVKHANVRAFALLRVGVLGEVARPGFYSVPADAVLVDALTSAGGPTREARLAKLKVMRGGETVASGANVESALRGGTTLAALGVQSGDQFMVPRNGDIERPVRILGILVTIPLAILAITRFSK